MLRRGVLAGLCALAAAGCGSGGDPPSDAGPGGCMLGFIGDKTKDVAIQMIVLDPHGKSSVVQDGGPVPMVFPIQGGRVIFTGARAQNLDPCAVTLAGAIRDTQTQQVRIDNRTVNLTPGADGWGSSNDDDVSSFSNVPVCPNEWSVTDLFDAEYELIISVTDRGGRTATQTTMVRPACADLDRIDECHCICKAGYVLGEACGDAGAGAGGT